MSLRNERLRRSLLMSLQAAFVVTLLTSKSMEAQSDKWPNIPVSTSLDWTEPQVYVTAKPASNEVFMTAMSQASTQAFSTFSTTGSAAAAPATLPLWLYNVVSSRDRNGYFGLMIGKDPFRGGGTAKVPTIIIPLALKMNTIGTGYNSSTGVITTSPGTAIFNPMAPENACMTAPNNVPATVFRQSPLFEKATFRVGNTDVGTTQYIDAFQRASFWKALDEREKFHVLLSPIVTLPAIAINVPAAYGTTRPAASTVRNVCGPQGIVDINWLDDYLINVVIPALAPQGVNSGSFPIFQLYNVAEALSVTNLRTCCIGGYHGAYGPPIQTYSVSDFETSGFFSQAANDTAIVSHEIGEWVNDPFGFNLTPPWGHTGQVGGCQANLEVGDPLTGLLAPSVIMPNGFTYHLQEMAFYSWFLGGPSVGVHGWYSNNGYFTKDAGPTCR
jgi:hypothetical protein